MLRPRRADRPLTRHLVLVLCASVGAAACGGGSPIDAPDAAAVDAGAPDGHVGQPDAAVDAGVQVTGELAVMRVLPWVGGGVQLAVELPGGVEVVPGGATLQIGGNDEPAGWQLAGVTRGVTAILLVPSADSATHAARQAAAAALIDALPADEPAALLVARATPDVLADVALGRERILEQLAGLEPEASAGAAPLADVRDMLGEWESKFGPPGRALVVVGEDVDEAPVTEYRVAQTFTMPVTADPAGDAAAVLAEVSARRARIAWVGACPTIDEGAPMTVHLEVDGAPEPLGTTVLAPAPMTEMAGVACVVADAASDAYPYPDEVAVTFTAEERLIYDERYNNYDETPFRGSIALGDGATLPADLHFRGQGTLGCVRKSLSVAPDGPRRRLAPEVASDKFVLISMCQDRGYFRQVWGNRMLEALGQYPMKMRYVRLTVDGVSLGVYLLIERPEDAMRDGGLATETVVRRRYDIFGELADVKYPADPIEAEAARLRFEEIGDLALAGPAGTLDADLRARLDLDSYLRQLAAFSVLQNGDYIDEAFFYAALEPAAEYYRSSGWDTDDIGNPCHGGGGNAIVDACGLTYCAEAEIDHALLRSTEVYDRYQAALGDVLAHLTPAVMASAMAQAEAELRAAISDDVTAQALLEMTWEDPSIDTEAEAETFVANVMAAALTQAQDRHAVLTAALAACDP